MERPGARQRPAYEIKPLATLNPASSTRAWQSQPHPNLPLVATASSDKSIRVYSLTSFNLVSSITGGHKRSVRACAWKPHLVGESILATGSFDASCGIWRKWEPRVRGVRGAEDEDDDGVVGGGEEEEDFTNRRTRGGGLNHGGDEDEDGDEDDYRFAVILDGHESEIKSVAYSSSGQYLATCSRDKSVWIWEDVDDDGENYETVAVLQEHEGDVKCVAWHPHEDLLASASYDEEVRLWREDVDDWVCCAVLRGFKGTVWWVQFEPDYTKAAKLSDTPKGGSAAALNEKQEAWLTAARRAGPRLVTASDDMTIRIWKRRPKDQQPETQTGSGRIPSILRTHSVEEEWYEDAILPSAHDRSVYAAAWSPKSGLIASVGSDGRIVVYKERWKSEVSTLSSVADTEGMDVDEQEKSSTAMQEDGVPTNGTTNTNTSTTTTTTETASQDHQKGKDNGVTEWIIVAEMNNAHDVFEVNHVTWTRRRDKGRRSEDEEVLVTTGDDGEVKVWTLEGLPP